MKLTHFLTESSLEQSDSWKKIAGILGDNTANEFANILNSINFVKYTGETVEDRSNNDGSAEYVIFNFSDGVVNVAIRNYISTNNLGGLKLGFTTARANVNPKFMLDIEGNDQTVLTHFAMYNIEHELPAFKENLQKFQKVVEGFTDWYFDMSGKYGKIKLLKTHYNILEGYHSSDKSRFIAIAGDFYADNDITEGDKFEPRVL